MKKSKFPIFLLLSLVFLATQIFLFNSIASADIISYHSNSGVGFYGEYEFPDDKKPPVTVPDKDGGLTIVSPEGTGGGDNVVNTKFPQTGEQKSHLSLVGLIAVSCYYYIKRKQKNEKKESYIK